MSSFLQQTLWKNLAGAIDMLGNCISLCPQPVWESNDRYFYLSYHCIVFLDYYLSRPVSSFASVLPYTLADMQQLPKDAVDDVLPSRRYSRSEMLHALATVRKKAKQSICSSEPDALTQPWIKENEIELHGLCPGLVTHYSVLEITLYNLRHLQHHIGQLNQLLRENKAAAAEWIAAAD